MRTLALILILACTTGLSAAEPAKSARLFDGKTFAGWEGETNKIWRVESNALVGGSLQTTVPHNEFLCTQRPYTNFVLRLAFKVVSAGGELNAGVQIRSQRITNHFEVSGYQADMGEPEWWGCLYDESRRNKVLAKSNPAEINKILRRNDWNLYEIRCEGKQLQAWINGWPTFDYTETDDKIPQWGYICLQIHGGGKTEAMYSEISIEELP